MAVRRSTVVFFATGLLAVAGSSHARTWHVERDGSGDFTTIQPAVDAAAPGDTIEIGPGEYPEYQTIRPPLWDSDIDIYAYITIDNLTIIGAGSSETVIGPPVENIVYQSFSPKAIWAGNVDSLGVYDLTVRNCYTGIYGPIVTASVGRSRFDTVNQGIFFFGQMVAVDYCEFVGVGNSTKAVYHTPACSYSRIRNCTIRGCGVYLESVEDYYIGDCSFTGGRNAAALLGGSVGSVVRCTTHEVTNVSFSIAASRCTMSAIEIVGGRSGFWLQGGELVATGISVRETTDQAFYIADPDILNVHGSNILPSTGYALKFESSLSSPSLTYDFTRNYWGVTDSTTIAELIWDAHDSSWNNDYADFVPFEYQLGADRKTFGGVKALFRDETR